MRIHNQQELMEFWEEIYGQVKPVWRRAFLKHDAIKEILTYQSDQIKVAVRRNQKLNDVLKDLYHQSQCKEEFDRKQNPFYDNMRVDPTYCQWKYLCSSAEVISGL